MDQNDQAPNETSLLVSSKDFFIENLHRGMQKRKLSLFPEVIKYLADLLEFYIHTDNFVNSEQTEDRPRRSKTFAELLLEAQLAENPVKFTLLKRIGDKTLYVSGFFADSLNRSLVDLDYYKQLGVTAYNNLAELTNETHSAKVFNEMASRFTDLTDLLTLISQESMVQNHQSILRLYESYLRTGSELAKERLADLGVIPISVQDVKKIENQ